MYGNSQIASKYDIGHKEFGKEPEVYIESAPNNSNETYTFMHLDRPGRFWQC